MRKWDPVQSQFYRFQTKTKDLKTSFSCFGNWNLRSIFHSSWSFSTIWDVSVKICLTGIRFLNISLLDVYLIEVDSFRPDMWPNFSSQMESYIVRITSVLWTSFFTSTPFLLTCQTAEASWCRMRDCINNDTSSCTLNLPTFTLLKVRLTSHISLQESLENANTLLGKLLLPRRFKMSSMFCEDVANRFSFKISAKIFHKKKC